MRVIACASIILLHTVFASSNYFADSMSVFQMTAAKAVQNNLMWAVPCFLMITGALLLDPEKEITMKKLFGKYILKMVLALVIFTLVFRVFDVMMSGETPSFRSIVVEWLRQVYNSTGWAHMWYLYLMIGMYILLPFYKVITAHMSTKMLIYLTVVYAVFISILPLTGIFGINPGFYVATTIIYPIYFFLGYMIHKGKLAIGTPLAVLLTVGCTVVLALLSILRFGGTDIVSADRTLIFDRQLFGYQSIFVIGQSVGIFTLLSRAKINKGSRTARFFEHADKCSFGIYIIHMIFVNLVIKYMEIDPYTHGGVLFFAAAVIVFFFISYVITAALREIPGARRVL